MYFLKQIKHNIGRHLVNLQGWCTTRKIVVIESDDWGSIRMPSKKVYNYMLNKGIRVDQCPYNRYDSLASEEDLQALFNVLIKFKDKNLRHPIITANTVIANPDFERIKGSNFQEYFYEPFTTTLKKYPNHQNSFEWWKFGISKGLFHPQFHGREHVNVHLWLNLLNSNNPIFHQIFNLGFWGIGTNIISSMQSQNIQASFDATHIDELEFHKNAIIEGLKLFEAVFKFKPKSFIANNFIWDPLLDGVLAENDVNILQGMKYQLLPKFYRGKRKKIRHVLGELNEYHQTYLIRNCVFEPTIYSNRNDVNRCLNAISIAFFWKKPAIISSHRLNFIGYLDSKNRDRNLNAFEELLSKMLFRWPDIEFMSSDEFGSYIFESLSFDN